MGFSYQNLWNTLERCHMSKTDLRQKLGLSTATLAKLSANQPVALEVLDKICEELGCTVADVITHQPDSFSHAAWSCIREHQTYLLNMFFYLTEKEAAYIYGFATLYQMTEGGMDVWELSRLEPNTEFLALRGYASGRQLLAMMQSASEKKNIGQLLAEAGASLRLHRCTCTEQDAVFALFLCNGVCSYRPAFLLSTQTECSPLLPQQMPLQSFSDETMCCESLFGSNKQALYAVDGYPSPARLRALFKLFCEELPIHHSLNEMARLNNFEVFTPLLPVPESEAAISWRIDCKEAKGRRIPESLVVCFHHRFLQGLYLVNVRACNTNNAFLDFCEQIYCGEEDVELRFPLQEGVSRALVRVWRATKNLCGTNLVYSSTHDLFRHFHLDMHLSTRRFRIMDEWTRRMEQEHQPVEAGGAFYSTFPVSFGEEDDEIWLSEERKVQKDFHRLLGTYEARRSQGIFFREGSDKHIQFLAWLKKLLADPRLHRVILIDPFITADSISKLLRSISNTGISYEIVTDTSAGQDPEKRLNAIRSMGNVLDALNPGQLNIHAVTKFLHDRYLILLGEDQTPTAYILTNSLDKLAEQHASVALPADKQLSREIFDYYLDAFAKFQENGQLESLYRTVCKKSQPTEQAAPSLPSEACTPDGFCKNFSSNLPLALTSLAYMKPEQRKECYDYVLSLPKASILQKLSAFLDEYPENAETTADKEAVPLLLSASQLLLLPFDAKGQLFESAESLLEHPYYYMRGHRNFDVLFAGRLLWQLDPAAYCGQLRAIHHKLGMDPSFSNHRLICLGATMLGQLAEFLGAPDSTDAALDALLHSDIPLLCAIACTHMLAASLRQLPHAAGQGDAGWHAGSVKPQGEEALQRQSDALLRQADVLCRLGGVLPPKELLFAKVYQMQRLQILICKKPAKQEQIAPLLYQVTESMADGILSIAPTSDANELFSNDDLYEYLLPLYSRNSEDICRILQALQQKGYLSKEAAGQLFLRLFFEKYKSSFSNTDVFFDENDIMESCMILGYLNQADPDGLLALKKELAKLERQLGGRLYHAFLKTKNYRLWKCSTDLLCCLVFMELWIFRCYQKKPSAAVKEFQQLSENFRPTLEKHSKVYNYLLREFPELNQ